MTAEIAIMNLQAVALAADSASTTWHGGNLKVNPHANKLFALSDFAPVGILVFGNASFMSIPWETIVKEYRRHLSDRTFNRLQDYADDFWLYLSKDIGDQIDDQEQQDFAKFLAFRILNEIKLKIHQNIEQIIEEFGDRDDQLDVGKLADLEVELTKKIVDEYYSIANSAPLMVGATKRFVQQVNSKHKDYYEEALTEIFSQNIDPSIKKKLSFIATRSVVGFFENIIDFSSGVVIAGFGDKDLFPAISRVKIEGMILGKVKTDPENLEVALNTSNRTLVLPFAQIDMVYQFMEGIAPEYMNFLHQSVKSHLEEYTDQLLKGIEDHINIDTHVLRTLLIEKHPMYADSFLERVKAFGQRYYSDPIVGVVESLPKEQLAEMAESLVNLTALKRRV